MRISDCSIRLLSCVIALLSFVSLDAKAALELEAWWRFEESSGSDINDSANSHHGTASAGIIIASPPTYPAPPDLVAPPLTNDYYRSFDGVVSGPGIVVPHHEDLNLTGGNFRLEFWVYDGYEGMNDGVIMSKFDLGTDAGWSLQVAVGGSLQFSVEGDMIDSGSAVVYGLPGGEWTNITFEYEETGDWTVWKEGAFVNGGNHPLSIEASTAPLVIGGYYGQSSPSFYGYMDEVKIFIPEPATLVLLVAAGGLVLLKRRRSS